MSVVDLKEYELTLLLNTEESNSPQDDRINAYYIIRDKSLGGWKTLAYPVRVGDKEYDKGYFVFYDLLARDDTEAYFLTRLLDSDSTVMRYMMLPKGEQSVFC